MSKHLDKFILRISKIKTRVKSHAFSIIAVFVLASLLFFYWVCGGDLIPKVEAQASFNNIITNLFNIFKYRILLRLLILY